MLERLRKDFRCVCPVFLGVLSIFLVALIAALNAPGAWDTIALLFAVNLIWITFSLGCFLLGSMVFGHDFDSGNMSFLLAQPVGAKQYLVGKRRSFLSF